MSQYSRVLSQYLKNVVTCKYNIRKYCHNSRRFWSNFEDVFCKNQLKSHFQSNDLPQPLKYIEIALKLANIALAGKHIFQVLGQYSWVLPQYLQVLSQYLRALSRWIHPLGLILSCLIEKVKNANKGCNFYILQK